MQIGVAVIMVGRRKSCSDRVKDHESIIGESTAWSDRDSALPSAAAFG
jgi:hypothetical protein